MLLRFRILAAGISLLLLANHPARAIDLGLQTEESAAKPLEVQVVNEEAVPVQEKGTNDVREITSTAQLKWDEVYESPYLDVREYRNIAIYVLPSKVLNEPQTVIRYKLDALFSVDVGLTEYRKFGAKEDYKTTGGYQEFGAVQANPENEEGPGTAQFMLTTTGETSSRVLYTPVYGPFVRVILKNLTMEEIPRKFRIVAYLSR